MLFFKLLEILNPIIASTMDDGGTSFCAIESVGLRNGLQSYALTFYDTFIKDSIRMPKFKRLNFKAGTRDFYFNVEDIEIESLVKSCLCGEDVYITMCFFVSKDNIFQELAKVESFKTDTKHKILRRTGFGHIKCIFVEPISGGIIKEKNECKFKKPKEMYIGNITLIVFKKLPGGFDFDVFLGKDSFKIRMERDMAIIEFIGLSFKELKCIYLVEKNKMVWSVEIQSYEESAKTEPYDESSENSNKIPNDDDGSNN